MSVFQAGRFGEWNDALVRGDPSAAALAGGLRINPDMSKVRQEEAFNQQVGLETLRAVTNLAEAVETLTLVKAAAALLSAAVVPPSVAGKVAALEIGKQGKHIPGHNNFDPLKGRSPLTHSNPQSLLENFAGRGTAAEHEDNRASRNGSTLVRTSAGSSTNQRVSLIAPRRASFTIHRKEPTLSPQLPDEASWLRARILLAVQAALLGEVTNSLIAVGLRWSEDTIEARFYYDVEPDEGEQERVRELETLLIAGFPDFKVSFQALPNRLEHEAGELMALAYRRAE